MIISEPEKVREQMIKEFSKYIKSKTSCRNLEKAIYNWSIDKSKENKTININDKLNMNDQMQKYVYAKQVANLKHIKIEPHEAGILCGMSLSLRDARQ